jgi:hypothetical protein
MAHLICASCRPSSRLVRVLRPLAWRMLGCLPTCLLARPMASAATLTAICGPLQAMVATGLMASISSPRTVAASVGSCCWRNAPTGEPHRHEERISADFKDVKLP